MSANLIRARRQSKWQTLARTAQRIAPKVLLPVMGWKEWLKDTLRQKSGYRGWNG